MNLTVNGEPLAIETACTVSELLVRYDLASAPCAVEVNTELVPKRQHSQCTLADGDVVEIVTLVGGG